MESIPPNLGSMSQQRMSDLMQSLGEDNIGWAPAFQDYKVLLEQLKSQDEMITYEAIMSLSNQLSMAQENTLSNFTLDQYVPALIDILKRPPLSDISNEINMFTIQCLTNLMDIFPNICNSLVNHGAVKCFVQVLEQSMGFIDLNDACIKALEKISIENPYAILTSGAVGLCLNMMDFFDSTSQKRIINILLNISRHSASEQDLNDFIIPLFAALSMQMQARGDFAQAKIESISSVILRVSESIVRLISPHSQFEKLTQQYETLGNTGIIDSILQSFQEYSILDSSMKQSLAAESNLMKSSSELAQSQQKQLTTQTIQNFLKVLSLCSKYSVKLARMIMEFDIFRLIEKFLPSFEDMKKSHFTADQFPFIIETITLIDSLLPEREEPLAASQPSGSSSSQIQGQQESEKKKQQFEGDKRALYLGSVEQQRNVAYIAEKLLPRIFSVYENNISAVIRTKTLQIIDKLVQLFNEELLNNFIEPYSFAKFIYSNMRSNSLQSILLCLQMVDKLMKSNPKSYTLPLIREGVSPFIKKLATPESLEKTLGISLKEGESLDKSEEFLIQAKNALLGRGQPPSDSESKAHFEQTLQKYLEIAKLSASNVGQNLSKTTIQNAKSATALASSLMSEYFENEGFQAKVNEWCGEEFQVLNNLKVLSQQIVEEAQEEDFNFDKNKKLMMSLVEALSSQRKIMTFEFKESGLLDALQLYLTHTPQQVRLHCEKLKVKGEEVKHSEEIQINTMTKNAKNISKKQARCYIQRLKVFLHMALNIVNHKQPIVELVNLCHELMSQSEYLIFENQAMMNPPDSISSQIYGGLFSTSHLDPNQSVSALKQLTRRIRINLIYDPKKSFMKKYNPATTTESQGIEPFPSDVLMQPGTSLQKSASHHPAFINLAEKSEGSEEATHSKVFIKRNFLYKELKDVLISVESCASLYLLEDFLRSKVKTSEDVKNLKAPSSSSSYYGHMKSASTSKHARQIIDRALDRMRELLETSKEKLKEECEEVSMMLANEIIDSKDLSEIEQMDIIRQLEIQTLQMLDEFYTEQDNQMESQDDHFGGGLDGMGSQELETEQKIYEFQHMIEKLRETYRMKRQQKREEEAKAKKGTEESKKKPSEEDAEMTDQHEPSIDESGDDKAKKDDVDMTDEEEEEARRQIEELERKRQMRFMQQQLSQSKEVQLSAVSEEGSSSQIDKEILNTDLEDLIKANGEDIEYEFYFNGQPVSQNQTLFEIVKNGGGSSDSSNIYFCIRDKCDDIKRTRKDSILEFSQKVERTKSEAYDEISVSTINSFVQQLIDKEFQVFASRDSQQVAAPPQSVPSIPPFGEPSSKQVKEPQEMQNLDSALKILKVLNYLCHHSNLLSHQGMQFLINSYQEEEIKEEGFSDFDMQTGLSHLNANIFHHPKLDAFILKNIQDPYTLVGGAISDTLQQIFKNCSFLFPFQTRLLFFKLISFIGAIDMNRSIYFLRQFLKQKVGKLPEDKNAVKFQKQKVSVDRSKILESAFALMKQVSKRAFLEVQYKEEQGTGLGPTLEFYYLVSNELRNQALWRKATVDNTLFPAPLNLPKSTNEEVQKVYELFRLAGMMLAKSLSDDRLIDLPISPLFWDIVLGKKMNLFDLERIDKDLFKVFAELQLLANKKREIDKQVFVDPDAKQRHINSLKTSTGARVEDLGLAFTLPGYEEIELKIDGKNSEVTINNLQEYLDLAMHYFFHDTIKIQVQAFKKGFNMIFPIETLKPFSTLFELEDMICGTQRNSEEWTNQQKLADHVKPAHGYHSKSVQYLNFLRFMGELDQDERRKFLKFVTGSPRLPHGGFASLDPKLTVVLKKPLNASENVDDILPSVMTCQNYVKLPCYTSYEVLKFKFQQAYNEGCNNFTLS